MKFVLTFVLFMAACPPRPTPPPDMTPAAHADLAVPLFCPAATKPVSADVCKGFFATETHLPCFQCGKVAQGCIDMTDWVYCAQGPCSKDPRCKYDPATDSQQ